jgi:hypothetical protein
VVGAMVVTHTVQTVHDMALPQRFLSHIRAVEEAAYTTATKRLEEFVRVGQRSGLKHHKEKRSMPAGVDKRDRALGHSHASMRAREAPPQVGLGRGSRICGMKRKPRTCQGFKAMRRASRASPRQPLRYPNP